MQHPKAKHSRPFSHFWISQLQDDSTVILNVSATSTPGERSPSACRPYVLVGHLLRWNADLKSPVSQSIWRASIICFSQFLNTFSSYSSSEKWIMFIRFYPFRNGAKFFLSHMKNLVDFTTNCQNKVHKLGQAVCSRSGHLKFFQKLLCSSWKAQILAFSPSLLMVKLLQHKGPSTITNNEENHMIFMVWN